MLTLRLQLSVDAELGLKFTSKIKSQDHESTKPNTISAYTNAYSQ